MNIRSVAIFSAIGVLMMAGCGTGPANTATPPNANTTAKEKPAVDHAALEAELRAADLAWSEAAGKKDVDAVVGFMTDDGSTLPPNEPVQKGNEALKKGWSGLLGLKDLAISWKPAIVTVAESGETGYTNGNWEMSFTDPKSGKVTDKGKYIEIWKHIDGKWKCFLDMYSSDLPPPTQK